MKISNIALYLTPNYFNRVYFQMGGLECVITGLMDEFRPFFNRVGITREIFTGMIVSASFIVALCCVTPVSI